MEKLLDRETRIKVQEILENMEDNVQLVLIKGSDDYSEILEQLLNELKELNGLIEVKVFSADSFDYDLYELDRDLLPAMFILDSEGIDYGIRFYGVPGGHEFITLLQDILIISTKRIIDFSEENIEKIKSIDQEMKIRVFVTPTCPYCPKAVLAAHQTAIINTNIIGEMIEANEFKDLSDKYNVKSVPHTVIEVKENGVWKMKNQFIGAYPQNNYILEILKAVQ